jgi:hypothetical protein
LAVKKCGKFNQVRETPYKLCTLSYAHLRETPLCGYWHFYAWRGLKKYPGWGPYRLDYLPQAKNRPRDICDYFGPWEMAKDLEIHVVAMQEICTPSE